MERMPVLGTGQFNITCNDAGACGRADFNESSEIRRPETPGENYQACFSSHLVRHLGFARLKEGSRSEGMVLVEARCLREKRAGITTTRTGLGQHWQATCVSMQPLTTARSTACVIDQIRLAFDTGILNPCQYPDLIT